MTVGLRKVAKVSIQMCDYWPLYCSKFLGFVIHRSLLSLSEESGGAQYGNASQFFWDGRSSQLLGFVLSTYCHLIKHEFFSYDSSTNAHTLQTGTSNNAHQFKEVTPPDSKSSQYVFSHLIQSDVHTCLYPSRIKDSDQIMGNPLAQVDEHPVNLSGCSYLSNRRQKQNPSDRRRHVSRMSVLSRYSSAYLTMP